MYSRSVSARRGFGSSSWLSLLCLCGAAACAEGKQEPQTASSVDNPAYAVEQPKQLAYLNQRVAAERAVVGEGFGKFREFPPTLGETDWNLVRELYEAADDEGQAEAYAEAQREAAVVQRFMSEEEPELVGRITSSVQYAAKEKSCASDVQFGGYAQRGLERGVDKQLEERRRQTSQVQRRIDAAEKQLGQRAAERLRDQVDQISFASYVVHVGLPSDELRLQRALDEADRIRATLEDEKQRPADGTAPDSKRLRAIEAAQKQLDAEQKKAQEQLKEVEQADRKLADEYQKAFDALIDDVEARAAKSSKP